MTMAAVDRIEGDLTDLVHRVDELRAKLDLVWATVEGQRADRVKDMKARIQDTYNAKPESKAKLAARRAVYRAMKAGTLVRPGQCQGCGAEDREIGTSRPRRLLRAVHVSGFGKGSELAVQWLCPKCCGPYTKKGE